MAHKEFIEYLERKYDEKLPSRVKKGVKYLYFPEINLDFDFYDEETVRENLFSLETVILLNDMLDVQKQMLENFGKLLLKQEVLDKKLTDLQEKTTQISANLQSLKSDVQGIKNNNTQLSTNTKNSQTNVQNSQNNIQSQLAQINTNVQNIAEDSHQTKQDVAEMANTLKCVTKGSYKKSIRVEHQD